MHWSWSRLEVPRILHIMIYGTGSFSLPFERTCSEYSINSHRTFSLKMSMDLWMKYNRKSWQYISKLMHFDEVWKLGSHKQVLKSSRAALRRYTCMLEHVQRVNRNISLWDWFPLYVSDLASTYAAFVVDRVAVPENAAKGSTALVYKLPCARPANNPVAPPGIFVLVGKRTFTVTLPWSELFETQVSGGNSGSVGTFVRCT
jgi:hypothetical protein